MPIVVRHLSHVYMPGTPMAVPSLHDVSFEIADGESVGLIGPTGSGKSTLVQHLNGLIRPRPGTVLVDGHDVGDRRTDMRRLRRTVGLVFQYPEYQLFEETVYDDVAFGPRSMGLDADEVDRRVRRAMAMMGLDVEALARRSPFELSGGQRRRVAIAGVLALGCSKLILDEPTAGLDPGGRRDLLRLLARLNREGMTVLLVTHDMDDLAEVARRVLVLSEGRLVADAPVRELFAQHRALLQRHRLDVPATVRVLYALRDRGADVRLDRLGVGEVAEEILRWWRATRGPVDGRAASEPSSPSQERRRAHGHRRDRPRPVRPR
ncbi:energy-coupling factor transporter ATPase [Geochorda subterranea]|uniref:Energy-coupling factor transporter ATP-binding protein EcfA2 n=1 Tax=Geochorda subterranea TaxID=3109564 RepID=A0ABZ1BNR7_9FIRM|nr:energy-coupling factor transporter ATPase [Limnochorda sp. LNt]WRP14128.1 energy-coupling factor transporter ATPase [Limnochorda sp. LNt]